MNIISTHKITTSQTNSSFVFDELSAKPAPFAYHINSGNYGFAKFYIDEKSIKAFSQKLNKVKSSMSRKQIYNILYDMLKSFKISGA